MSKVVGNVRVGEKRIARSGKSYPSGRDTFRITSKWNAYLMPVHTVYGGKINSWSPDRDENAPKNQFEIVTDTNQLQICMVPSRCVSESWQLLAAGREGARLHGPRLHNRQRRERAGVPVQVRPDQARMQAAHNTDVHALEGHRDERRRVPLDLLLEQRNLR